MSSTSIDIKLEKLEDDPVSLELYKSENITENEIVGIKQENILRTPFNQGDETFQSKIPKFTTETQTYNELGACNVKMEEVNLEDDCQQSNTGLTEGEKNQQKNYVQSLKLNNSSKKYAKIRKCDICNYETRRASNYRRHLLSHISKRGYIHKCLQCEFQTKDEFAIYKHMGQHSNANNTDSQICQHCDIQTFGKHILPQHNLPVNPVNPSNMKECYYQNCRTSEKVHVFSHESVKEVAVYKCSVCDYQTKRKGNLTHHALRHKSPDELYMFSCDQCSYQSFNKCRITTHLLTHKSKSEVELFKCIHCDYHTKYKADLGVHILRHKKHIDVKTHKCPECKYAAIRKCDLNRHLLRHKSADEVKMHQCPTCEYKTVDRGNLNKHIFRHHTNAK